MEIKFIFFKKSRSTVLKMSIAGESPELKIINYLQPIMEKLLQPMIDYSYRNFTLFKNCIARSRAIKNIDLKI